MRIRITFAKTEAMRFTGHLDLHHAWERAFRRAGLPLAYSQGFSPHPRLNLACALPLGFTSLAEVLDAWLDEDLPLPQITKALQSAMPPGIQLREVTTVDPRLPSLQSVVQAAEFTITYLEPIPDLAQRVKNLLAVPGLPRRRRDKDYDLRPLVLDLQILPPDTQAHPRLTTRLSAREGATGRPEELLDALGLDPLAARVERTKLVFDDKILQNAKMPLA